MLTLPTLLTLFSLLQLPVGGGFFLTIFDQKLRFFFTIFEQKLSFFFKISYIKGEGGVLPDPKDPYQKKLRWSKKVEGVSVF